MTLDGRVAAPGGDVGDVGDLRVGDERAVEGGERVHDRPRNQGVARAGEKEHPVRPQSRRITLVVAPQAWTAGGFYRRTKQKGTA